MRVLQLIDSLEAGGAERMAVHYANALSDIIEFSALATTRKEGVLFKQLHKKVAYLYLKKKYTLDIGALLQLKKFIVHNKISVIHAHSTSFLFAFLLKVIHPSIRLIWHDHYGESEFLKDRPSLLLKIIIPFFSGIIVVNQKLKEWSKKILNFENVIYLPNFSIPEKENKNYTILKGEQGRRIVALANLRPQKDHFLLLDVAERLKNSHPDWTFHLIGKNFNDDYSNKLKLQIEVLDLQNHVYLYGTAVDIKNILSQSTIGILTSKSEGLPVTLLEYANNRMPVVVTNVGEIGALIKNGENGFLIEPRHEELFYEALVQLIESPTLQLNFADALFKTIDLNHSEKAILQQYLLWLQNGQ